MKSVLAVLITLAIGILVIWVVYSLTTSQSGGQRLEASISRYDVVNPSQLSVEYIVKNPTDKSIKSLCSISMHDESTKYSGNDFGYESAREIRPGETYSGVASLTISNEGARYITKGGINCKAK